MSASENKARTIQGRVISAKGNKSITVAVDRLEPHPLYGKYVRKTTKLHAHDENNAAGDGDLVALVACRPVSKSKQWRLESIIEAAGG